MRRVILALTFALLFLSSCSSLGMDPTAVAFFYLIVIVFIIVFIWGCKIDYKKLKQKERYLTDGFEFMGHYVYGHPKVKSPAPDIVYGRLETGHIVFYQIGETEYNVFPPSAIEGFKILCNNIEDARVEDETTFESRITIPRMFVAGLYSLAWKKRDKHEAAFLRVIWRDGRFTNETVFGFDGTGAISSADKARNFVISCCKATDD
ncbi:MAG TPA: hypothetical protein IAD09_03910 [Candidatus Caccoplasma merdavium]|nr:hypothetical protein [Candidatus Caccoplasma merdavium]